MIKTEKPRAKALAGELVVPAIMLGCVGFYWTDAVGLSIEALAFPLALTAVVVLASAFVIVTAVVSSRHHGRVNAESLQDRREGTRLTAKTWAIALLPVPLIYFWREIGAIPVLFFYVICVLFFLGERRRSLLITVPSALALALVYLFKTILYVRLPDSPWLSGAWPW